MLTKEYRDHQNCLNLGLIPVYSYQPIEHDCLPEFYVRSEGQIMERLGSMADDCIVDICETSYEIGHWSTGIQHVRCFIVEFFEVTA